MFSAFNLSKCTHTWNSGQPTLGRPGSSWGFGALLKALTSVVDNSCRSRDSNPQPRVTSPTLYPLATTAPKKDWSVKSGIIIIVCLWHSLCFHSIPQMLCLQSDPPVHTSFPSVHAFIMLEGTMNLTGETQPLVEQLMMIKRMQVTSDTSVRTDEVVCVCGFSNVFFPLSLYSISQLHCLCWRSGRPVSLGSLNLQRGMRNWNGQLLPF